jgi:hypothetical protein
VIAEWASGGSSTVTESRAHEATVVGRLPNRRLRAPASSMVATAPADKPSSASPRAAADASTCSLTAGTRTAQLA